MSFFSFFLAKSYLTHSSFVMYKFQSAECWRFLKNWQVVGRHAKRGYQGLIFLLVDSCMR